MGVLALTVWPGCSRELLVACLCHDLGEYGACDAPVGAKADPTLRATLDRLEEAALARLQLSFGLSVDDTAKLRFLDRWDAFLWAQHHAPQIIDRADWQADRRALYVMALDLGVADVLRGDE
jgi:5'-deoxynucleotidase YfbR-like HD superfamily hydrolase